MSAAALFVDPRAFSLAALEVVMKRHRKVDVVLHGMPQSLAAAETVCHQIYDLTPSHDITVFLRFVPQCWERIYSCHVDLSSLDLKTEELVCEYPQNLLPPQDRPEKESQFGIVAVAGTFDHLHAGHKLLLTLAGWVTREKLIIGVTGPELLVNKKYAEALESFETREAAACNFVKRIYPQLKLNPVAINDVYGPTAVDPNIDALVISSETTSGASLINDLRQKKGWKPLNIVEVQLVGGESKLSSTDLRAREIRLRTKV